MCRISASTGKLIRKALPDSRGQETVFVYAASYYYAELSIAAMLYHLNLSMDETDAVIDTRISKIEKATKTTLDEHQREAVAEAVRNGLLILTGGPGTGKNHDHQRYDTLFRGGELKHLSGSAHRRAAKRMTEATGCQAQTIHRMLELSGGPESAVGGRAMFARNEENPLEADVIIIDEMSMVDLHLMQALHKSGGTGNQTDSGGRREPAAQRGTRQYSAGYDPFRDLFRWCA